MYFCNRIIILFSERYGYCVFLNYWVVRILLLTYTRAKHRTCRLVQTILVAVAAERCTTLIAHTHHNGAFVPPPSAAGFGIRDGFLLRLLLMDDLSPPLNCFLFRKAQMPWILNGTTIRARKTSIVVLHKHFSRLNASAADHAGRHAHITKSLAAQMADVKQQLIIFLPVAGLAGWAGWQSAAGWDHIAGSDHVRAASRA